MSLKKRSIFDQAIKEFDQALRALTPGTTPVFHHSPGHKAPAKDLSEADRKHLAGLMRINHTGEVCAQALYNGQALTAHNPATHESMTKAAKEEIDHLAWCEEALSQLNSSPSKLNPIFYGLSYLLGAVAGKVGDRWSLGFVNATEEQVCAHLEKHLKELPEGEEKCKAILEQMIIDEKKHAVQALAHGGQDFPKAVKKIMAQVARVMTFSTYRI